MTCTVKQRERVREAAAEIRPCDVVGVDVCAPSTPLRPPELFCAHTADWDV